MSDERNDKHPLEPGNGVPDFRDVTTRGTDLPAERVVTEDVAGPPPLPGDRNGRMITEELTDQPPGLGLPVARSAEGGQERSFSGSWPPERLGAWVVEGMLGEGGMGQVFKARHESTGEVVAVKTIRPDRLRARPQLRTRFVKEARHTEGLRHENILAVREVVDGTPPYYVMPFVEGGSLKDAAGSSRSLPPERLLPIMLQVVSALEHAHREGKVHRDVKPANILIGPRGRVYVSDFGLVTSMLADVDTDSDAEVTDKPSFGSGTAPYMAPELFAGEAGDYRVDVYAVGAMMYELLAGSPPYEGDPKTISTKVQSGPPVPLRQRNSKVPRGWVTVVEGAMARDLHARYASIRDLRADLERLRDGDQPLGPARERRSGRPWLVVGASVATVGLLAIAGSAVAWFVLSDRGETTSVATPTDPSGPQGPTGGASEPTPTGAGGEPSVPLVVGPGDPSAPPVDDGVEEPVEVPSPIIVQLVEAVNACTEPDAACVDKVGVLAAAVPGPLGNADRDLLASAIETVIDDDRGDLVLALRRAKEVNLLVGIGEADSTLLHKAAQKGRAKVVAAFLQKLPSGSEALDANAIDVGGKTAIMLAAVEGHASTVKVLIDAEADVTVAEGARGNGDTVLHMICGRQDGLDDADHEIVLLLIESLSVNDRRSFVNGKGRDGDTALHRLVRRRSVDDATVRMLASLISHGGDPDAINAEGDSVEDVIDDRIVDKARRESMLEICNPARRP